MPHCPPTVAVRPHSQAVSFLKGVDGHDGYTQYQAPELNKWASPPYKEAAEHFDLHLQSIVLAKNQAAKLRALQPKDFTIAAPAGSGAIEAAAEPAPGPVRWSFGKPLQPKTRVAKGTAVFLVAENVECQYTPCFLALGEVTADLVSAWSESC